ncbi:hypothetical protein SGRIM128S_04393 [Streptomyces griseomycini]
MCRSAGPAADALREHAKRFPPVGTTSPWKVADGPPVTGRLVLTGPPGGHSWRTSLNEEAWRPAPAAAGVLPGPERGRPHAESRERSSRSLAHDRTRPNDSPEAAKSPLPAGKPQAGGLLVGAYFFLPWFLTASIAAAAASGSRYLPPGVTGLKSVSSS